jgi:hypothetical protein
MKVAITGSTGLVGSALVDHLRSQGHDVVPILRGDPSDPGAHWDPANNWIRDGAFDGIEAVINLSGASIGDGRWTARRKRELETSRIDLSRFLISHLGAVQSPPRIYVQSSAVGYYGPRGDEVLDEESAAGQGYLAGLVADWEAEAGKASDRGMRVALIRSGLVLSGQGGALKKMLLPFKLGIGGKLGSGKQYFSWVSLPDIVNIYTHALGDGLQGVVNGTSPNPVTNAEYTKALGRALHRPTLLPTPGFGVKLLFGGELTDELLLSGQRVVPAKLQAAGFRFQHPTIDDAFDHIFKRKAA